ncbi:MAG: hypothetical protein FRX48_08218 [Lasallia pustulata]|uniref:Uncharacterized protein n=1 Tax=Lasallia pustulata TaxID=136370 RepID=A0A5M8PET2_9LECA|nr:MAG: hypothetical protein FRX48_08218 [Lasallia pustulata]
MRSIHSPKVAINPEIYQGFTLSQRSGTCHGHRHGHRPLPAEWYEYSLEAGTKAALQTLFHRASKQIPAEIKSHTSDVIFSSHGETRVYFPCPFKETEAASALKVVEAGAVAAIADLRYAKRKRR